MVGRGRVFIIYSGDFIFQISVLILRIVKNVIPTSEEVRIFARKP